MAEQDPDAAGASGDEPPADADDDTVALGPGDEEAATDVVEPAPDVETAAPEEQPGQGRRGLVLKAVAGLVLGWAIAAAALFVWPPQHPAVHTDAIVVLAGGRGPRLARGLELVRRGVAPVLAVSDGWSPAWPEANRLCAGRPIGATVVCFHPQPYDTHGEAEAVARIAAQRGWSSVEVVSSRYHVVRARMLFQRCFHGTVYDSGSGETLLGRILASPVETVKLGYALLIRRGC
jgi:uncharacterized SAM-binding protein YcdF (DUF218 family)